MADPFSNEALRGTLNTQAEIYKNIRNKALEEAAAYVETWGGKPPSPARRRERLANEIRALKTPEA